MRRISLTLIAAICCLMSGFCKPAEAQGLIGWTGPTFTKVSGGNYGQTWSSVANGVVPFNTPWDPSLDNMDASAADPRASGDASANCVGMIRVSMGYHRRTASESIYQNTDPEAAEPDGLDPDPVTGSTHVMCIFKGCACYWCWPAPNPKIKVVPGDFVWNLGTATGASVTSSTTTGIVDGGEVPAAGILSGTEGVSPGEYGYAVKELVTCKVQQAGASYTILKGNNYNTYQDYVMFFDEPMTASISPSVCQPNSYMQTMEVKLSIGIGPFEFH